MATPVPLQSTIIHEQQADEQRNHSIYLIETGIDMMQAIRIQE
jgi:hypothetical protein